jgi:Peptidase S46
MMPLRQRVDREVPMVRHPTVPVLARSLALLLAAAAPTAAQDAALDTIRAGRFDFGKMWTFEYPPSQYFSSTYGFDANAAWFERARLAALRIPGCSASFVSRDGLLVTNHHCVRGRVTQVARPGETLLDDGFFARSLAEERPIAGYYADQLVATLDVSDELFAAVDHAATDDERDRARRAATDAVIARLRAEHGARGDSIVVQVVALYHGGRYSAYVFRRFTDIRLVAAAELQMGFFGGDEDNFTYPRYDLDFAFLRVYGPDGRPHQTDRWFTWSKEGVHEGDVVFVIGNPGPTNRLMTVAQLEFQRDVLVPQLVALLTTRLDAMRAYQQAKPEEAEAYDIRNRMFGLSNSLKASRGRLAALRDPTIMARKRDAERQLRGAIAAQPDLQRQFGDVLDRLAAVQKRKTPLVPVWGAMSQLTSVAATAAALRRALTFVEGRHAPSDSAATFQARFREIPNVPADLERRLLAARLADIRRYLGPDDPLTRAALGGREPDDAATALLSASILADSARAAAALLPDSDPALRLASAIYPRWMELQRALGQITREEAELASRLGRARFAVYGRDVPPDATSSPRITDGVVRPYEYNGTVAPVHTTFFGVYDRHASFGPGTSWDLPARWKVPPAELDLATPLNFISTADTYGGNSGSPAVRPDLSIVGLNFDRNIEGLSRDFVYLPERGRNMMVDVRAIREALDHVYDLDRIVQEVLTGQAFATEAEADAAGR